MVYQCGFSFMNQQWIVNVYRLYSTKHVWRAALFYRIPLSSVTPKGDALQTIQIYCGHTSMRDLLSANWIYKTSIIILETGPERKSICAMYTTQLQLMPHRIRNVRAIKLPSRLRIVLIYKVGTCVDVVHSAFSSECSNNLRLFLIVIDFSVSIAIVNLL